MPALSHRLQLVHSDTTASIHSSSPVSSATSPPLRTPQARKITGTASNPAGGAAISNARFDFTFTGDPGLQASQITLQYPTGATTFGTVPLSGATTAGGAITGYFGPLGGFSSPLVRPIRPRSGSRSPRVHPRAR